jgi:hypothetical protein
VQTSYEDLAGGYAAQLPGTLVGCVAMYCDVEALIAAGASTRYRGWEAAIGADNVRLAFGLRPREAPAVCEGMLPVREGWVYGAMPRGQVDEP